MTRPHLVEEQRSDGVSVITRSNPPVNALTLEMSRQLRAVLREVAVSMDVRAVIMTGEGTRSFGAGSDIEEFKELIAVGDVVERKMAFENETFSLLATLPQPTIAALNGSAFGGGLEIALACDLIVAEEGQLLGFPEIKLGLFPGSGGPVRVARRIGEARTRELIYLGDPIPAEQALEWGLVNRLVPPGEALASATEWGARLAHASVSGLRAAKTAIHDAVQQAEGEHAIAASLELTRRAFAHPDALEGAEAFLSKRQPQFPSTAAQ